MSVSEDSITQVIKNIINKITSFFSEKKEDFEDTEDVLDDDDDDLYDFNEENVIDFVKSFVKEEDILMCIDFALGENFMEPEDYESYGCNHSFVTAEYALDDHGIQNKEDFKENYMVMHNYYLKPKITAQESMMTGFPPAFNFPSDEDFTLKSLSESEATIYVDGKTPCLFTVKKDDTENQKMIITSIMQSIKFVGDIERLDY